MFRLIGLLLLALIGFYGAWPAYTGYRIKNALDTENAGLLASKIDFDAVRTSLRPSVTAEVEKSLTAAIQKGGGQNEALLAGIKTQIMPKVVDAAMATIVTPESILRIYRERDFKKTVTAIIAEKMGGAAGVGALGGLLGSGGAPNAGGAQAAGDLLAKFGKAAEGSGVDPGKMLGGLLGKKDKDAAVPTPAPAPAPATTTPAAAPATFGVGNVKSFSINGPLGFSVGVAKDQAAVTPDLVADMAFSGFDWKLVGLRPRG
jgi:hypothetical protein